VEKPWVQSTDRKVIDKVLNYRQQMKINQTKLREIKLKKEISI